MIWKSLQVRANRLSSLGSDSQLAAAQRQSRCREVIHFFTVPPQISSNIVFLDCSPGRWPGQASDRTGEPRGGKSAAEMAERAVPKAEIACENGCLKSHQVGSIRYNRWFRKTVSKDFDRFPVNVHASVPCRHFEIEPLTNWLNQNRGKRNHHVKYCSHSCTRSSGLPRQSYG